MLVLGGVDANLRRGEIGGGKAIRGGGEKFRDGGFVGILRLERAGQRELG